MKKYQFNKIGSAFAVAAALLISVSCSDDWNEHYDASTVDSGTLWSAIQSNGNLSNFTRVVKECGYDLLLNGSQTFSVFAPTDDVLSSAQADSLIAVYKAQKAAGVRTDDNTVVKQFLQNHMTLYKYPVSSLTNDSITMMNGKYEVLTGNSLGGVALKSSRKLGRALHRGAIAVNEDHFRARVGERFRQAHAKSPGADDSNAFHIVYFTINLTALVRFSNLGYSTVTVTVAETASPDSVAQVMTCLPGDISAANAPRPIVSPAGAASTNHQSRVSGGTSPTWQTMRCSSEPETR